MAVKKNKHNRMCDDKMKLVLALFTLVMLVLLGIHLLNQQTNGKQVTENEASEKQTSDKQTPDAQQTTPGKRTDLRGLEAGTIVEKATIDAQNLDVYFTSSELTEVQKEAMNGKSYIENPDISYDDLRYIKVLHYNFRHQIQVGELIVNQAIAEDCRQIFMELFQEEYEINSMYLIDRYYEKDQARNGEQVDISSINDDNTSAFHYRKIAGTEVLSNHAYGMAIDINPLENPYVKEADLQQTVASPYKDYNSYKDRTAQRAHMISKDDACYRIFKAHGFQWGGEWNGNKDYQHFEKDR
ncbi:MAG: M15 family peptidase [Pseudobutyrivibrio sp.]|nr:M15 family peptidase [Pseudobutyrivibrio sp.]